MYHEDDALFAANEAEKGAPVVFGIKGIDEELENVISLCGVLSIRKKCD